MTRCKSMERLNQTSRVSEFILMGLSSLPEDQKPLFIIFFIIYLGPPGLFFVPLPASTSPLNFHPLSTAGEPSPHFTVGLDTSQLVLSAQLLCLFPQPFLLTCWLRRKKYIFADEPTPPPASGCSSLCLL